MSLTFLTPLYYGYQAYTNTRSNLPIEQIYDGTTVRLQKGTPRYNDAIKRLCSRTIKEELQPFLEKMGVREDLIVLESLRIGLGTAYGTNFFTKGDAAIGVATGFNKTDKDACRFVIKHEISHIIYNDCFTTRFVPAVCTTAAAIFTTFTRRGSMLRITLATATAAIGILSYTAFSRYCEGKADDFAIAESSNEELKGGRRFFLSLQADHKKRRKTIWDKIRYSSSGEYRLDIEHPSLDSRIKKVEDELIRRNVDMYPLGEFSKFWESYKIYELEKFITNVSE